MDGEAWLPVPPRYMATDFHSLLRSHIYSGTRRRRFDGAPFSQRARPYIGSRCGTGPRQMYSQMRSRDEDVERMWVYVNRLCLEKFNVPFDRNLGDYRPMQTLFRKIAKHDPRMNKIAGMITSPPWHWNTDNGDNCHTENVIHIANVRRQNRMTGRMEDSAVYIKLGTFLAKYSHTDDAGKDVYEPGKVTIEIIGERAKIVLLLYRGGSAPTPP